MIQSQPLILADEVTITKSTGSLALKPMGITQTYLSTSLSQSFYRNFCLGLTPTLAGNWTTAPTNLTNATDGDLTTSTGTGTIINNQGGELVIDLGINTLLYGAYAKVGIWGNGSDTVTAYLEVSKDNSSWTELNNSATTSATESVVELIGSNFQHWRYIKVRCTKSNNPNVGNIKIYEVEVK